MPRSKIHRPSYVTDEHLEYLDELQESAVINMYGSGKYLEAGFSVTRNQAKEIVQYWMNSYDERNEI